MLRHPAVKLIETHEGEARCAQMLQSAQPFDPHIAAHPFTDSAIHASKESRLLE
jgi:hypothetical protein